MIEHLGRLPSHSVLDTDICIVGTGAAGLTLGLELLEAGLHVVLLESGDLSATNEAQALCEGDIVNDAFRGMSAGRSRRFGGTTSLWGGQCLRLDPLDFQRRDWVPHSGWPLSPEALAPFYDRAERRLGVPADTFAPGVWRRFGLEGFAFDPDRLRPVHGVFMRRPKLGQRFRSVFARAPNARVLLGANATNIGTNPYGTEVSHVDFRGMGGKTGRVRARRVVLCAGGIENARLLLLSDHARPRGLANEHDLVGRYFQDHPCGLTADLVTAHPRRLQDHFNMLYGRSAMYLPKVALGPAIQRKERVLNCVGRLTYDFGPDSAMKALRDIVVDLHSRRWPERLPRKLFNVARGLPVFVPGAWRVARRGLSPAPRPSRIHLEVFTEQTPNPDSRLSLSRETDAMGLRRARLDWRLDPLTGRTLRVFTDTVAREFERLGLARLERAKWLTSDTPSFPDVLDSYHPSGTTRMADDPSRGVVDPDCQAFGVAGLYVAGSSVFPTSGVANPTFSIVALALRLADHLRRDARDASAPAPAAVVRVPEAVR